MMCVNNESNQYRSAVLVVTRINRRNQSINRIAKAAANPLLQSTNPLNETRRACYLLETKIML
jgi:hypothetical protein